MDRSRIEAFSDGVIAILITIMVLELRVPETAGIDGLRPLLPVFGAYVMSFVLLGIYWNNHHHLFQAVDGISGGVLWANLHLLFWLSLIPFGTAWIGRNHFASLPMALYGAILMMAGVAYFFLVRALLACGENPRLAAALGSDWKGKLSVVAYAAAIPLAFVHPAIAGAIFVGVAVVWFVPDRRIEKH